MKAVVVAVLVIIIEFQLTYAFLWGFHFRVTVHVEFCLFLFFLLFFHRPVKFVVSKSVASFSQKNNFNFFLIHFFNLKNPQKFVAPTT
jgi:hypothetical protein